MLACLPAEGVFLDDGFKAFRGLRYSFGNSAVLFRSRQTARIVLPAVERAFKFVEFFPEKFDLVGCGAHVPHPITLNRKRDDILRKPKPIGDARRHYGRRSELLGGVSKEVDAGCRLAERLRGRVGTRSPAEQVSR